MQIAARVRFSALVSYDVNGPNRTFVGCAANGRFEPKFPYAAHCTDCR